MNFFFSKNTFYFWPSNQYSLGVSFMPVTGNCCINKIKRPFPQQERWFGRNYVWVLLQESDQLLFFPLILQKFKRCKILNLNICLKTCRFLENSFWSCVKLHIFCVKNFETCSQLWRFGNKQSIQNVFLDSTKRLKNAVCHQ